MRFRYILKVKNFSRTGILFLLLFCIFPPVFAASDQDQVQIPLKAGESLRQFSKRLLGDGDAWPIILRCNGIAHPDALSPGIKLRVPIGLYTNLQKHLAEAALLISKANQEGAALLAKKDITEAVRLREQALVLKKQGTLRDALKQAALAEAQAKVALSRAKNRQTRVAQAWVAATAGTVQNRRPGTSHWQETKLQQKLQEREKVRTLADSRCQIKFSDQSQLSLGEQALVVIGSMKKNIIRSAYSNSVSIFEGDLLVHLASLNQKKSFEVKLPDIKTDIRSLEFLASHDKNNVTRIANYDGEIDIISAGGQVTVKKNQGTKVVPGQQPTTPKKLLLPPIILMPKSQQKVYGNMLLFRWKPVSSAWHYQIEISDSTAFTNLFVSEKINTSSFHWKKAPTGEYFFRIKTVDQNGCPGPSSEPLNFFIYPVDTLPPYLVLYAPAHDMVLTKKKVDVRGEVEKNAVLRINGKEVEPDKNGYFQYAVVPENAVIIVKAMDFAGNVSTVKRTVRLQQQDKLMQLDGPEKIFSKTKEVTLSGRLQSGVQLRINKRAIQAANAFTYMLHLPQGEHRIDVEAIGLDGQQDIQHIEVVIDLHPPKIQVNDIQQVTAQNKIMVKGTVSEQGTVRLNDRPVSLSDKSFEETVSLSEGNNRLVLVAKDLAGNRSSWNKTVLFDTQPPKILKKKLSIPTTKGGEVVRLTVWARDDGVGTARSGSFILEVNKTLFRGTLKKTGKDATVFAGNVFILPGVAGAVKVRKMRIEDMLGNAVEYAP
ncbi:FecR domain-containing protein [Desulfobulbus sp. TB]|nr:FecR domain-containing protein [Desulfobulbus sp. TB]